MADKEFANKVVIVTGAASGLGKAVALAFAAAGARLVIADLDDSGLDATAASVKALGAEVAAIKTDVSDTAACSALIAGAAHAFGQIDALCNIAGVCRFDHAGQITPDIWDRIHAINVRGPFFLIQAALPHLIETSGAIVNCASASAFLGHAYLTHYASSKAALVNLTKSLAMELMHTPVRINAVAPGGINSAMTTTMQIPEGLDFGLVARYSPLRGTAEPEELADLFLMLAGPRGRIFHGDCINADRGITAG